MQRSDFLSNVAVSKVYVCLITSVISALSFLVQRGWGLYKGLLHTCMINDAHLSTVTNHKLIVSGFGPPFQKKPSSPKEPEKAEVNWRTKWNTDTDKFVLSQLIEILADAAMAWQRSFRIASYVPSRSFQVFSTELSQTAVVSVTCKLTVTGCKGFHQTLSNFQYLRCCKCQSWKIHKYGVVVTYN